MRRDVLHRNDHSPLLINLYLCEGLLATVPSSQNGCVILQDGVHATTASSHSPISKQHPQKNNTHTAMLPPAPPPPAALFNYTNSKMHHEH
jgi:hypothetical protein